MKFLVALVIVACAIGFSECDLTPEQWAKLHEKIVECGAKEGASDADVQELLERKQPSTHLGKCTVACVMETGGMMKNNKVDLEGAVAMATRKDPSHAEAARELTIPCLDVTDADRCEAAVKISKCVRENAAARGITSGV